MHKNTHYELVGASQKLKKLRICWIYSSSCNWTIFKWPASSTHHGSNFDLVTSYNFLPHLNGMISSFIPWMWNTGHYPSLHTTEPNGHSLQHLGVVVRVIAVDETSAGEGGRGVEPGVNDNTREGNLRVQPLLLLASVLLVQLMRDGAGGNTTNYL